MDRAYGVPQGGLRRFAEVIEQHQADGERRPIIRSHQVQNVERLRDTEIVGALWGIVEREKLPEGSYTFRIGVEGLI